MPKKIDLFLPLGTIITDPTNNTNYKLIKLLGRGAFAQCYLAQHETGDSYAIKLMRLADLRTDKLREKLESEIAIHSQLDHPNIVKMYKTFRNNEYVFMILEMCPNRTVDELLKRNGRFREKHVRVLFKELVMAVHYLHSKCAVVHRDLKLANLFLDQNYHIKLGDFGLSAIIQGGQKKRTVCGTPNYIAPEVLFDKINGHSFEADIWSLGVILYTLLIGIPPFQKNNVKEIYKMIELNNYTIPSEICISKEAEDLIKRILTTNPNERPTLTEILEHKFFKNENIKAENSKPTRESCLQKMYRNISEGNYTISPPIIDHIIFSTPLSKIKGVGYILKSGVYGIYFNDHSNMLLRQNKKSIIYIGVRIENNRKILNKEEYMIYDIKDPLLYDKYTKLEYFVNNFSVAIPFEAIEDSFVIRIRRVRGGLLFALWNNVLVFDFLSGIRVVVYNEGLGVHVFNDQGTIEFDDELRKYCGEVILEQIK
ncbi:putative cell cycle serine/threonine-protein kinase CDC5 like protein [Astathelohania contejeani]|uniref:Serine/threonine-protein kinase n=1 Tax=Astathelohania contejeani TaxID=164912 RepID=A0ABQ7HVJ2_9MICR|nr:putative cell cycle serine/threonine-protein kinase CDC5 like protein [Thelohania contejeani]